jgi:hypothetical protein
MNYGIFHYSNSLNFFHLPPLSWVQVTSFLGLCFQVLTIYFRPPKRDTKLHGHTISTLRAQKYIEQGFIHFKYVHWNYCMSKEIYNKCGDSVYKQRSMVSWNHIISYHWNLDIHVNFNNYSTFLLIFIQCKAL